MLGDYLRAAAGRPWDWFAWDCCRFADEWVVANGHASPMDVAGVRYDSERSALLTIRRGGGLVALWRLGMAEVAEADDARVGDVGIIARPTDDGLGEACGIFTGERWATLGLRGLDVAPADDVLAVWAIGHG